MHTRKQIMAKRLVAHEALDLSRPEKHAVTSHGIYCHVFQGSRKWPVIQVISNSTGRPAE